MSVYSVISQTDKISIKPHEIITNIKKSVKKYLITNYENKITQSGVYVLKIIDINTECIKNGLINDLNGDVVYEVEYSAYIFDPIIGSSFEIVVTKCNEIGIWGYPKLCQSESAKTYLSESDRSIVTKTNGIIECISSNDVIVNRQYKNGSYIGSGSSSVPNNDITIGSVVKLKVLNRQIEHNRMVIIGTIL